MKLIKKRKVSKPKKPKLIDEFDEEISEDEEIIDDISPDLGGKNTKDNGLGELWKYMQESNTDDEEDYEESPESELPKSQKSKDNENQENNFDEQLSHDRLEESLDLNGNILDFDQLQEDESSYNWITQSSESNETYKGIVKKFKQIEEDVPEFLKPESQARSKRIERKAHYDATKKYFAKKWAPIVSHINKMGNIVYGEDKERAEPTCGTIYSSFKPETELEKELAKSSDNLDSIEGKALAKAILAREQKKNKRIKRIKSKKWHKRQKQRDLQVAAKLLSKIDDPDLANEIKNTFERKRAEKRILRKKEAQSKWAKMVLRFGGKDLLKEVSFQNQQLQNEYQLIDQVARSQQEREDSDSNSDDSDEEADDETENRDSLREIQQEKLNVILDPSVPIPDKGLFNMNFMKNAIIIKREKELNEEEEECEEDEAEAQEKEDGVNSDDEPLDYNVIVNHEGVEVDQQIVKLNKLKKAESENFTNEELEKAREEINQKYFTDSFSKFDHIEDKTSSTIKSIGYDSSIYTDVSNVVSDKLDKVSSLTNGCETKVVHNGINDNKKDKKEGKEKRDKVVVNVDVSLDDFIESLEVSKENEKNKNLIKEMFVTRPEEEDYLELSEDEKEVNKLENMAGWGSWTGHGIAEKVKENESEKKEVKKSRVKITNKKDPKLAKYYIHNLPHPFKNRHEYNSNMDIPIGPEWNTFNMHKKLIQPKTSVKIGSVILPLGSGDKKHEKLIQDYRKTIIRNRTHSRL